LLTSIVPVVAAAVDLDVADGGFGGVRRVAARDVEDAEDRLGAVPFLPEGGLGALDRLTRDFPIGVEPIRIAHHTDDAVLAVAGRQIARNLGGEIACRDADVVFAAFDLLLGGGAIAGVAGRGDLGAGVNRKLFSRLDIGDAVEGGDQLLFPHAVPAGDTLASSEVGEIFLGAALPFVTTHATPLRWRPARGARWLGISGPSVEGNSRESFRGGRGLNQRRAGIIPAVETVERRFSYGLFTVPASRSKGRTTKKGNVSVKRLPPSR